jgi:hypothetical protein
VPQDVYATIQALYHALAGYFLVILVVNLFREASLRDQVIGAIAVIPFALRLLGIK